MLLKGQIIQILPENTAQDFLTAQEKFLDAHTAKTTTTTKRKFDNLLSSYVDRSNPSNLTCNPKAVHNATTKTLPPETEVLLSLGPKFALPYTSVGELPIFHMIADLENVLNSTPDKAIRDRNRCCLVNILQNYLHSFDSVSKDSLTSFLQHACKVTKRFIKDNPELLIVQSDKGKQTVVMYEEDYGNKMLELLADVNTYMPSKLNPTSGFQTKNNNLVKRLLQLSLIDSRTAYQLRTYSSQCPRIYGLPKAHKQNLPLRPVVPNIGGPSYMMSKYVGQIVRASIKSEYNITDSFTFCEFINSVNLPPAHILVSFDVVSLFTCIPRHLVRQTITTKWDSIKAHTNINLDLFIELVEFCLECSYFSFRGKYYKQVFGTAMGNPFSPTAADLVMETLLEDVVKRLPFPLPLLKKYVDDLILAVPEGKVKDVLDVFNSFDKNLQFTCEVEKDGRIPYLDLVLVRQADQSIKTEWYSKPMASGRFLDYFSCHPLHMKMNMVANFVRRVRLFSTNLSEKAIGSIIDKHLKINHYPTSLRNRIVNRSNGMTQSRIADSTTATATNSTPVIHKPMPFIDKLTVRFSKSLKADFPNIMLATRNEHTVNHLFTNTKDTIEQNMRSNVIYKIPCGDCECSYIGLTSQHLKARISNHRSNIKKLNELTNNSQSTSSTPNVEVERMKEKTALLQHSIEQHHSFALDQVQILDQHRRQSALGILEMCHIITTENTVNRRSDVENLSTTYAGVLDLAKRKMKSKQTQMIDDISISD